LSDQEEVLSQIDQLKQNFMEEFALFCGQLTATKEKSDAFDLFDVSSLRKYVEKSLFDSINT
jgi:hypothetical protein